jgi:predicted ATPase
MESQVRFGELSVQGFRRLQDVHLPMRPLCVMIGANGSGKTSVLDVLSLLANSAQGRLADSLSDLGALPAILTYDRPHNNLSLAISMELPNEKPLDYWLQLIPQGAGYAIEQEALSQQREPLPARPFYHIVSRWPSVAYYDADEGRLHPPVGSLASTRQRSLKFRRCFNSPRTFENAWRPPPFTTS